MLKQPLWGLFAFCSLIPFDIGVLAASPLEFRYHGRVLPESGTPPTLSLSLTARIYDAPAGGRSLFEEYHPKVSMVDGEYSCVVGSRQSLAQLDFSQALYLGVSLVGGAEATPRLILSTSDHDTPMGRMVAMHHRVPPFALRAGEADQATDVRGQHINPGSVWINGVGEVIDGLGRWVGDASGLEGPTGPRGTTGPTGISGETGPQGATGSAGARGAVGSRGPAGTTGPVGPQGATGPTGLEGVEGTTGPTGASGTTGPTGPAGRDGKPGPTGLAGRDGTAGRSGPAGPRGSSGPQGEAGPPGASAGSVPARISNPKSNLDWAKAAKHCRDLNEGGSSDWWLPTIEELSVFAGLHSNFNEQCWTRTISGTGENRFFDNAFLSMNLSDGSWTSTYNSVPLDVRCVRR